MDVPGLQCLNYVVGDVLKLEDRASAESYLWDLATVVEGVAVEGHGRWRLKQYGYHGCAPLKY